MQSALKHTCFLRVSFVEILKMMPFPPFPGLALLLQAAWWTFGIIWLRRGNVPALPRLRKVDCFSFGLRCWGTVVVPRWVPCQAIEISSKCLVLHSLQHASVTLKGIYLSVLAWQMCWEHLSYWELAFIAARTTLTFDGFPPGWKKATILYPTIVSHTQKSDVVKSHCDNSLHHKPGEQILVGIAMLT